MSQASPMFASRRRFLRYGGTTVLSSAAGVLCTDGQTLAPPGTMSQSDLHNSARTQFHDVGDIRMAYRPFGMGGLATPVVCLQHFRGRMDIQFPGEFAEEAARFLAAP